MTKGKSKAQVRRMMRRRDRVKGADALPQMLGRLARKGYGKGIA